MAELIVRAVTDAEENAKREVPFVQKLAAPKTVFAGAAVTSAGKCDEKSVLDTKQHCGQPHDEENHSDGSESSSPVLSTSRTNSRKQVKRAINQKQQFDAEIEDCLKVLTILRTAGPQGKRGGKLGSKLCVSANEACYPATVATAAEQPVHRE
jgi:hypothetical protein